jgi:molybdopterin-guanine dinucleotide biosynthesis protein A
MQPVPAVIVAGGLARRMGGGDKCLLPWEGGVVLDAIIAGLAPQAAPVALNANGDPARFAAWGLPVLPDPIEGHPGPLAGILAALDWAGRLGAPLVLTWPGDAPRPPADLLARLRAAGAPAVARAGGRLHPVAGLWPAALAPALRTALAAGTRRVESAAFALGARAADFADAGGFLNLNLPEDLAAGPPG